MKKLSKAAGAFAVLSSLALAGASFAQDAATDPYQDVVDVFASDTMRERAFDSTMKSAFRAALEADQELAALEIECPGLMTGLEAAVRPIMWTAHKNDYVVYRQDLHAMFKANLSPEHAAKTAEFFGSELGERFFTQVFANQNLDNVMREAMATNGEEDISSEAMRRDNDRTAIRAMMALEPVDRMEINRIFAANEWAQEFAKLRPQMDAILADPKFQNFTPEEDAAIEQTSMDFSLDHFDKCFAAAE